MSSFRPGRGHNESRKSVFYTNEEWELLDPSPKDLEESVVQEERKKPIPEGNRGIDRAPVVCHSLHYYLLLTSDVADPLVVGISRSIRPNGSCILFVGDKTRRLEKLDVTRNK